MPSRKEEVAAQFTDQLNTLAQEGKFKELAELIVKTSTDARSAPEEERADYDAKIDATMSFYKDFTKLTPDNKLDPKKKEIAVGLLKAFAEIRTRGLIETGLQFNEWKQRLQNGEVPEVELAKETDPKYVEIVAHDIALNKTEAGRKLLGGYSAFGGLVSILSFEPLWAEELKKPEINKYHNVVNDLFKNDFTMSVISEYPDVPAEDITAFHKRYGNAPQSKGGDIGFYMEPTYALDDGKVKFTKLPDNIKEIMDAKTPEQLDAFKKAHEDKINDLEEFKSLSNELAFNSRNMLDALGSTGSKKHKDNQLYRGFKESLQNLTRIGTNFKTRINGHERETDAYFKDNITKALEETINKGKAFYDVLKDMPYKNTLAYEEFCDEVYESLEALEEKLPKFKKLGSKLPIHSIDRAIEEENKYIARIDRAAKMKGYTATTMKNAHLNTKLGEFGSSRESSIAKAKQANKVFTKHNDYDDAIKAMEELAKASNAYKKLRDSNGFSEEQRKEIEKLREQARQAQQKINAYVERKETEKKNKGKLDSKGTNRLDIMKGALNIACEIQNNMDENLSALDSAALEKETKELEQKMLSRMRTNRGNIYEAAAMANNPNEKIAGEAAAKGIDTIADALETGGEITPEQQAQLRDAAVKYALYIGGAYPKEGELTAEGYEQMIAATTSDKRFADKFNDLTREQLQTLAVDGDNKLLTDMFNTYNTVKEQLAAEAKFEAQRKQSELEMKEEINAISKLGQNAIEALDNTIKSANDPDAEKYEDMPVSAPIQAAQTAKKGMSLLIDMINDEGVLDPDDIPTVREAYAALAIQSRGMVDPESKISHDDYLAQVRKLANDKDFIKTVGNVEKDDIMTFIKDDKAPAKLMDQVISAKKVAKDNEKNIVHGGDPEMNKNADLNAHMGT